MTELQISTHLLSDFPQGHFRFEGPAFPTIQELILYQHSCNLPVTNKSGAILRSPIYREHWELNNDDVQLVDKIGRVSHLNILKLIEKHN